MRFLIWKINSPIVDGWMMIEVYLVFLYVSMMDGQDWMWFWWKLDWMKEVPKFWNFGSIVYPIDQLLLGVDRIQRIFTKITGIEISLSLRILVYPVDIQAMMSIEHTTECQSLAPCLPGECLRISLCAVDQSSQEVDRTHCIGCRPRSQNPDLPSVPGRPAFRDVDQIHCKLRIFGFRVSEILICCGAYWPSKWTSIDVPSMGQWCGSTSTHGGH